MWFVCFGCYLAFFFVDDFFGVYEGFWFKFGLDLVLDVFWFYILASLIGWLGCLFCGS